MNVARHVLNCTSVTDVSITNVDRLGVDFRVTYNPAVKVVTDEFRVGFRVPIMSVEDAKSECVKVFQEAWERGEGMVWEGGSDDEDGIPVFKLAADGLSL